MSARFEAGAAGTKDRGKVSLGLFLDTCERCKFAFRDKTAELGPHDSACAPIKTMHTIRQVHRDRRTDDAKKRDRARREMGLPTNYPSRSCTNAWESLDGSECPHFYPKPMSWWRRFWKGLGL